MSIRPSIRRLTTSTLPTYGQDTYGGYFSFGGSNATSGSYSCGNPNTNPCTSETGYKEAASLADFIIGARNTYQLNNFVIVNYHQRMNFFYVQDDLRLTRKLTINAGLRYELVTPQWVEGNHLANFVPPSGTTSQAPYLAITTGTLQQASGGSMFNRALVHTPQLDLAPRLGFSYGLNDKTVMRGGYGISFDQFNREGGENLLAYN
jgi:hypothetical protein